MLREAPIVFLWFYVLIDNLGLRCIAYNYALVMSSGKIYRLRNPSRKYLASLSSYDSSNPTKDWGFPNIYANSDNDLDKQSSAQCQSEVMDVFSMKGVSAASAKVSKEELIGLIIIC